MGKASGKTRGAIVSGKQLPQWRAEPARSSAKTENENDCQTGLEPHFPSGEQQAVFNKTKAAVKDNALHTVCQEARCPNIHDCWASGDATFMIAGKECTRGCRFCAVGTIKTPPPLDVNEPEQLADAVDSMNLRHVVITVVNRDDLPDSGADHYKKCIEEVHRRQPQLTLELLCSDLAGDHDALAHLLEGSPLSVFAHNVECVPRLDRIVRDSRASFSQSLEILRKAKELRPDIITKSSLMVESEKPMMRFQMPSLYCEMQVLTSLQ